MSCEYSIIDETPNVRGGGVASSYFTRYFVHISGVCFFFKYESDSELRNKKNKNFSDHKVAKIILCYYVDNS